jgi:hypothetical protein
MKNKRIQDCDLNDLNNFSEISKHLINCLKDNWEVDVKPNGYDEYRESYEEHDDSDDIEFSGLIDNSSCKPCFPDAISLSNVAYSDTQQSRDPLTTLVNAILSYGIDIGKQRAKLEENNDLLCVIKDFLEDIKNENINQENITKRGTRYNIMMDLQYPKLKRD